MNKRLLISEEERNNIRRMQLLEQVGPDPEIVETLRDMGFEKQFCKNAKVNPMGIELSHEYCNKARPQILVSALSPADDMTPHAQPTVHTLLPMSRRQALILLQGGGSSMASLGDAAFPGK